MYKKPIVTTMNNDVGTAGVYQKNWAMHENYLLSMSVGIFVEAIFQIDATIPLVIQKENE